MFVHGACELGETPGLGMMGRGARRSRDAWHHVARRLAERLAYACVCQACGEGAVVGGHSFSLSQPTLSSLSPLAHGATGGWTARRGGVFVGKGGPAVPRPTVDVEINKKYYC